MKYTNGQSSQQSSFLLNSQSNQIVRTNPRPLQQPLLYYLFQDQHEIIPQHQLPSEVYPVSQIEEPSTIEPTYLQRIAKGKKTLVRQRVKTDLNQDGRWIETIDELKSQNKVLREQLLGCQKKLVGLESIQIQAEYLAKVSLLQQSEIQKLRRMLRQANYHQLEKSNQLKHQHQQQRASNRNFINGHSVKVTLSKNKENCRRNSLPQQKCAKKQGSFTREPFFHSKTISDWTTVDKSSSSHCKKALKKNGSRQIQQKLLLGY